MGRGGLKRGERGGGEEAIGRAEGNPYGTGTGTLRLHSN